MQEQAVGPDQPPRPPGDLNTYLPDPPERLGHPNAPLRTRTRRSTSSPARNWKTYYPFASADAALKQRRSGGRVGPEPHPLPAKQGPPGPLRPDSACAHEQRRLPWFLPGRNFLIPFFGLRGLPGAERALVPPGEQDTVAARCFPPHPPTLRFRGSGRKCEGPLFSEYLPFFSPPL